VISGAHPIHDMDNEFIRGIMNNEIDIVICRYYGCKEKKIYAKSFCKKHYNKLLDEKLSSSLCSLNCMRKVHRRKLCRNHYEIYREKIKVKLMEQKSLIPESCSFVDGCNKKVYNKTNMLCRKHYKNLKEQ
jgi:hypothetical protein